MKRISWGLRIIAAASALAAVPGHAAEPAAPAGGAAAHGPVDVELPPIFAPMVVNSRLQAYAYITVALTPASPGKALDIRAKVPFLQDAFLREVNKGSIVKEGDPKAVDVAAVKAKLSARMNSVLPAGTVSDLELEQIVYAPLQPNAEAPAPP